ncbi:MAG: cell division protein SepF [Candidatus Bathyarchaeia archaeon]
MPNLGALFRIYKKKEKREIAKAEAEETSGKTFLKAMPLRDLSDLEAVKKEVRSGNILILRITPLANKSIEDVKLAVNELCEFVESVGGDIARLGEERVVICPPNVKIWREKAPVASEPIPTAA